jgi:hypothetical protein
MVKWEYQREEVRRDEAGKLYGHGIQLPEEENKAGGISGDHGRD